MEMSLHLADKLFFYREYGDGMQVYFIVNPKSGKGLKVFQRYQSSLTIPYTFYLTKYRKHAIELTEQIKQEDPQALVIAVGGDGTINEVINGAVNSKLTIGVISSGSGNDFARYFYCFTSPADIERFIHKHTIGQADIGQVSTNQGTQYFINNSGLGFDALICERVSRSKLKPMLNRFNLGKLIYVYYVLLELIRFKPFQLKIAMENGIKTFENVWFIAASNQPYFGGGMKISPHSNAEDGKLEYTIIHRLGKCRFVMIFLKVFKGNHLGYKQYVEQLQGQTCQAYAEKSLFGHVDGEVFTVQPNEKLCFSVGDNHLRYATDQPTVMEEYIEMV